MFVNEDLTLANKNVFDAARRDLLDLSVWTSDGKVLVRLVNNKIVRINSKQEILDLI